MKPWKRPKGRVLFAHVESPGADIDGIVWDYTHDRRNDGTWTVQTFPRTVRVDGLEVPCVAVVVRERFKRCPSTATDSHRSSHCTLAAGHEGDHVDESHPLHPTWLRISERVTP